MARPARTTRRASRPWPRQLLGDDASGGPPSFIRIGDGEGFRRAGNKRGACLGSALATPILTSMSSRRMCSNTQGSLRGLAGRRQPFPASLSLFCLQARMPRGRFRFGGQVLAKLFDQRSGLATARFGIQVGDDGNFGQARRGNTAESPRPTTFPRASLAEVPSSRTLSPAPSFQGRSVWRRFLAAPDRRIPLTAHRHRFPIDLSTVNRGPVVADLRPTVDTRPQRRSSRCVPTILRSRTRFRYGRRC